MYILFLAVPRAALLELLCSGINFPLWWSHNAGLNPALSPCHSQNIPQCSWGNIRNLNIWADSLPGQLNISLLQKFEGEWGQFGLGSPWLPVVTEVKNGDYCHPEKRLSYILLRNCHKCIGRRHCWLQELVMWQVPVPMLLHITWFLLMFPAIATVFMCEKRESTHCTHTGVLDSAMPRCLQMLSIA